MHGFDALRRSKRDSNGSMGIGIRREKSRREQIHGRPARPVSVCGAYGFEQGSVRILGRQAKHSEGSELLCRALFDKLSYYNACPHSYPLPDRLRTVRTFRLNDVAGNFQPRRKAVPERRNGNVCNACNVRRFRLFFRSACCRIALRRGNQ